MGFRLLDHTADVGIEATAGSEGGALSEAGLGLTAVLLGLEVRPNIRPTEEVRFAIEAPDRTSLAVAFLSELLWLQESKGLLWLGGGVQVTPTKEGVLRAEASGNGIPHDRAAHGRGIEVKAVTYSGLVFERQGKSWLLRVLLDI